ncbi:MAG TPA: glycosyltransferase family 39 protein [Gemmatimonadaceae bacterium]|nr:glycosyltransferase family 39 protein [Gemmatimonadaceae bacterium]
MNDRAPATAERDAHAWAGWVLAGILILATVLRIHHLGGWSLEQDELYTLRDATDFGASSSGPGITARPVYYVLQHVLLAIFPATPLALRIPAMVFGVLGVWLTWRVARSLSGVAAAAVASLLVAISPWHLYASQFARYWTLVYVLALGAYWLLPAALASDRPRTLVATALLLALGALTHPTFLFPLPGVVIALCLVRDRERWRWRWPSANAWRWLWGPLATFAIGGAVLLRFTDHGRALNEATQRGMTESFRIIPGMIQWIAPAVAVAAVLCALWLAVRERDERRAAWGRMTLLGGVTGLVALLAAGTRSAIYADYGMALLPLAYVAVGLGVASIASRAGQESAALVWGVTLLLVATSLPGTVSHLIDGTRFDYRPAYRYAASRAPGRLTVGWPVIVHQHYAPHARFAELRADTVWLNRVLAQEGASGIWLVTSAHRDGRIMSGNGVDAWMLAHCRPVLLTGRPRLDYRQYDVELSSCAVDRVASD